MIPEIEDRLYCSICDEITCHIPLAGELVCERYEDDH